MIIDTHCHYNLSPLYKDWQQHWQKAQDHGVIKSIIPGSNLETSRRAVAIAKQDENLYAAVGVHPHETDQILAQNLKKTLQKFKQELTELMTDPKVIAVGETGLDYFRLESESKDQAIINQQAAFKMQIELANQFNKILIIHSRDKGGKKEKNNQAYWDILQIIQDNYQFKQPFILHCVSGPKEYLLQALKMGACVGVGANSTYPSATELRELIKLVPKDKLLLETDAPYLPPQKFRGEVCQPWMIVKTAQYLEEMGIDIKQIFQNFAQFKV